MKKYIALLAIALGMALPTQAQYLLTRQEHKELNAMMERAQAKNDKIQATLTVEIPVTKQYFTNPTYANIDFADAAEYRVLRDIPTYPSAVGCKAYALSDHWLIAGAVCLWNGRHTVNIEGKERPTGLVQEDYSKNYLKIDGTQITMQNNLFVQPRFTLAPHFLLVRVPANSALAAKVKNMPKINVLALTHTNPLTLNKGTFYVNSSRFGWDTARLRQLSAFNRIQKTVTIKERFDAISTLSNDPLLFAFNEKIYWIGVNKGVMYTRPNGKWDGQPSKNFVTFDNSDLDFIERTIQEQDPASWPQVAKHLYRDHLYENVLEIL